MPFYGSAIRNITATNYHVRHSWKNFSPYFLYSDNNKPTNQLVSLSSLFSSTNSKDIESIESRLQGSSRAASPFYSGLTFSTESTNAPTMTAGSSTKTIGGIFVNDAGADDEVGIRGTTGGGNLVYTTNDTFRWFGSGILNKPIGDFSSISSHDQVEPGFANRPFFISTGNDVRIHINHQVIPEPAEYALVFGLFALAFVIVRSAYLKRNRNG